MKQKKTSIILLFILSMTIACSNNEGHKKSLKKAVQSNAVQSPLIRSGVIDVQSIDVNKDNTIYECPMDWNVLADETGDCPVCGMKLKEYSQTEVEQNLDKYGYEYKK